MKPGAKSVWGIIAAIIGAGVLWVAPASPASAPTITVEQVEADWLRQDELYDLEAARAAAGSDTRPVSDPADKDAANLMRVIERGLMLAENLRELGAPIEHEVRTLQGIAVQFKSLGGNVSRERRLDLYLQARWVVRRMALANPLLDFDAILFAKAAPGRFPHISDQYYGWWSRPGGGIFLLEGFRGDTPRLRCLTRGWAPGSFLRPDLSYDGKKVIFAYCRHHAHVPDIKNKADKSNVPEDAFYHIFEMNIDGTGNRQLTDGRYDDFDARYLSSGEIVFLSTRKGVALQSNKASAGATERADLPDSYVRCGGDNYRPVPVFTLHKMNADGRNLRAISAFENFEWNPAVANDGRILYTRWDYIDRFNGHFFSLWSTKPDGTNAQLVYGNYTTRPQAVLEARPVPDSQKIIFTAAAHHSITGGSLVLLDRTRGTEGVEPVVRLTPEVPFPETEAWPHMYYANPYPLSEQHYLVCWSDRRLPPHSRVEGPEKNPTNAVGLYLCDAFGNLNLLYRDPDISSTCPTPVRPRKKPPVLFDGVCWDGPQEGAFLVQDVCRSLDGIRRGDVKRIRLIGVPPKTQPHMNTPSLGVSKEDPGKFVLGTVPVERDGSAYFRAPSGIPVFFQVLDSRGMAVQTMRSLTYVQPGQTVGCVGCHESRDLAPPVGTRPAAARREPSKLTPGPPGSWPLRFDELVQPVLDKLCVHCHRPNSENEKAGRLDLTAAKAYENLLSFAENDLKELAFEKDKSVVGECPARKSRLLALLTEGGGHEGVRLDADSFERLVTWMDAYAQRQGSFSESQEEALRRLRRQVASLLAE
ncbi:MAG: HzsA-related protein [Planctomycetota bacterium]